MSPGLPIATWTRPVEGLKNVTSGAPAIGHWFVTLPEPEFDLHHCRIVARDVKTAALMAAACWELPMLDVAQFRQPGDMLAGIVIDHLHAVAARVGNEDAGGFGVERAVIEGAAGRRR